MKISPSKADNNQHIFKLVDDTLNFIDQELTKSYKQSNIGVKVQKPQLKVDDDRRTKSDMTNSFGKLPSYNPERGADSYLRPAEVFR